MAIWTAVRLVAIGLEIRQQDRPKRVSTILDQALREVDWAPETLGCANPAPKTTNLPKG